MQKTHILSISTIVALASALAASPVQATSSTTPLGVSASVSVTCGMSVTPLAFGSYSGTQLDAATTVSVTCSNGTAYDIGLDAGSATGATVTTRQMGGPSGGLLSYAIYQNTGRTTNWGNTPGTDTVAGTGSGALQTIDIYGHIAAGQFPVSGSYSDTVTVTISY